MVTAIRRRLGLEGGFTLIELLVVMIIISILMAVAIPVFLGQKQKALATAAKTNAKHAQDSLESCAAGTVSGTFIQGTFSCDQQAVIDDEPSLAQLFNDATSCGDKACLNITLTDADTYQIQSHTQINGGESGTFFVERSSTQVLKTCQADPGLLKRICPTGTW